MAVSLPDITRKMILVLVLIAGLYFGRGFLIPLSLGALIATFFLPLCHSLEEHRLPRLAAALVCLLCALLAIAGIGALLGWQLSQATSDINLLKEKGQETLAFIQQFIFDWFGIAAEEQSRIFKDQQGSLRKLIESAAGSMFSVFTGSILTGVYIVLLLYYRSHIKEFIFRVTPAIERSETEKIISRAALVSQQYLSGMSKMILCLWIMYGIGFSVVGVKNALFFAILCGLLEVVPFIGNITGTTLTLLVSTAHGAGLPVLAGIVVTYGTVQFIQGWVLEPLILGPHVRINPLFTIIVLVAGEIIWGIPGIMLAIPLTAVVKIIFDEIEPLKAYGFLIGETAGRQQLPAFLKRLKKALWPKKTE